MKSAMQELRDNSLFTEGEEYIQIVLKKSEWIELLEKEKQQTIDFSIAAYQDISRMKGVSENLISENKILFEEYYNQNYN